MTLGPVLPAAAAAALCLALALALTLALPPARADNVTEQSGTGTASTPPRAAGGSSEGSVIGRAVAVALGVSGLGLVYLLVRGLRLKKRQRKKYGLLSSFDDHVEMAPMDTDDDDTTLFEAKSLRR